MKTLKEFTSKKKYIAIIYDDESQKLLRTWAINNGFDLSVNYDDSPQPPEDFEFHTTIFYTTNEVNLRNRTLKQKPTEVFIEGIKFLGKEEDIPVLKLSYSGSIKDIREYYERLGLEDEWPDYQPHISLSYAKKQIDASKVNLPNFNPKVDRIVIKDIET